MDGQGNSCAPVSLLGPWHTGYMHVLTPWTPLTNLGIAYLLGGGLGGWGDGAWTSGNSTQSIDLKSGLFLPDTSSATSSKLLNLSGPQNPHL